MRSIFKGAQQWEPIKCAPKDWTAGTGEKMLAAKAKADVAEVARVAPPARLKATVRRVSMAKWSEYRSLHHGPMSMLSDSLGKVVAFSYIDDCLTTHHTCPDR